MISGVHVIIFSADAEKDRAFFRDVLRIKAVEGGHQWPIFALPPAEATIQPAEKGGRHELYLVCDDLGSEIAALAKKGVRCSAIEEAGWGSVTKIPLPGGSEIHLYQPKHPRAHQ